MHRCVRVHTGLFFEPIGFDRVVLPDFRVVAVAAEASFRLRDEGTPPVAVDPVVGTPVLHRGAHATVHAVFCNDPHVLVRVDADGAGPTLHRVPADALVYRMGRDVDDLPRLVASGTGFRILETAGGDFLVPGVDRTEDRYDICLDRHQVVKRKMVRETHRLREDRSRDADSPPIGVFAPPAYASRRAKGARIGPRFQAAVPPYEGPPPRAFVAVL